MRPSLSRAIGVYRSAGTTIGGRDLPCEGVVLALLVKEVWYGEEASGPLGDLALLALPLGSSDNGGWHILLSGDG